MIGYFDTSAVVPLVIAEPSSPPCAQTWQACDVRISSILLVAEAHAALAQALRLGRLTGQQHSQALELLETRLEELDLVMPDRSIANRAGSLALEHALRGYDAIHAATALALQADHLVAVAGDQDLLAAWRVMGLNVIDVAGAQV
ncbi:MAG: type II toxin-antitoxin system VapC family toxin [Micrococcales bacterium]|nr:type II toxin-antitoxin system VapC family toxin [Micrococcales bacterium]